MHLMMPGDFDEADATRRLQWALDLALQVLRNGGSTHTADRTFTRALEGCALRDAAIAWRLDTVAAYAVVDGRTVTAMRAVGPLGVHLARASAAVKLGEDLAQGVVRAAELPEALERVRRIGAPYPVLVTLAAAACAAGAFAALLGADLRAIALVCVAAAIGQGVRVAAHRHTASGTVVTLLASLASVFVAAVGIRLGVRDHAAVALIASVIHLVPGVPLINGFLDVVSARHVPTGLVRVTQASFLFSIIALALLLAWATLLRDAIPWTS
jgi:uncharacterized membrane protein YjjP (DUF1212 family)